MCATHAVTGHRVKSPEWQYDMSVRPVFLRPFTIFVLVLISSVGVRRCDAFIVFYPPVGSSQACMYVSRSGRLSMSLFGDQSAQPIIARRACVYWALVEIH